MKKEKNDLFDYKNRFIYQYDDAFKFSLDSVLLAEFVKIPPSAKLIVDFGTGNAPIPLILSTKSDIRIIGIELQPKIYEAAKKSVVENNLEKQIKIINDDIKNVLNYLEHESVNIVVCNPPYFEQNTTLLNEKKHKRVARHELECSLEMIFDKAKAILKNKGTLYLSHRITRIDDIILLGRNHNLGVKEVVFIDTKGDLNPKMMLVRCVKGSKSGVKIKYKSIKNLKSYQNIFEEV